MQIAEKPSGQQEPGSKMCGSTLAAIFNSPKYHCAMTGTLSCPEFAVTRLQSGPRPLEKAPVYPPDDALLVCVALTPTAVNQWRAIYKGREVGVSKSIAFATTVLDLRCPMEMWVRGPFEPAGHSPRRVQRGHENADEGQYRLTPCLGNRSVPLQCPH